MVAKSALLLTLSLSDLSQSPEWLALLHTFGEDQSEVVDSEFFLSPRGRVDPEEELKTTIEELKHSNRLIGPLKQTPYCAFPARLEWLQSKGFVFPPQKCADQIEFIENISPKSLTLVYSSAYPNNPASMFGHTMIRINRGQSDPLLDYGVNYAAQVPEGEAGIPYLWKGLIGLYPGGFGILPYYQKVLEYNEAESRDLWEYHLSFTEKESTFWVKHLWELRFLAQFRYAFLKKNCSYQLIRTLEVLRPDLKDWLPSNFAYTLPGETIRALKDRHPELFLDVQFRPSHFRILNHRYRTLDSDQRTQFDLRVEQPKTIAEEKDPYVLETLDSYFEYMKIQQQESAEQEVKEKLRTIRVTRAKLGGTTEFSPLDGSGSRTNRPDLAHGTRRISLTSQTGRESAREMGIRFRLGLHDLMNRDLGYEATFGVSGLDAEIALSTEGNARLKRLDLIDLISIQPVASSQFPLSWRVFSGWRPQLETGNLAESNAFETGGGIGIALEPAADQLWLGVFVQAGSRISGLIPRSHWAIFSAEPFLLYRWNEQWKSRLQYVTETSTRLNQFSSAAHLETTWSPLRDFEMRLSGSQVWKSTVRTRSLNQLRLEFGLFF